MKRITFLIVLFLSISFLNLKAQKMEVGTNFLSLGIGPSTHYSSFHSGGTPAFRIAYDHGFREIGPGTLTLGGSLGFFTAHYDSRTWDGVSYYNYTWRWTYIVGAFRLGYYYNFDDLGIPDLNAYAGLGLGLRYVSFSDNYNGPSQIYHSYDGSNTDFHFALYGGANYFLTKKLAIFLEFGYDISPVTVGATFKL
jgi:hypothetical protein